MELPEHIKQRYLRKTMAHPDGQIVHHGNCGIYQFKICTCGLIHDLQACGEAEKHYDKFDEEYMKQEKQIDKLETPCW